MTDKHECKICKENKYAGICPNCLDRDDIALVDGGQDREVQMFTDPH